MNTPTVTATKLSNGEIKISTTTTQTDQAGNSYQTTSVELGNLVGLNNQVKFLNDNIKQLQAQLALAEQKLQAYNLATNA